MVLALEGMRGRNAARFAASYAAWARNSGMPVSAVPARFRPLSLDELPRICGPNTRSDNERCRRAVASTLAGAKIYNGPLKALLRSEELRQFEYLQGQGSDCPYCNVAKAITGDSPVKKHAKVEIGFNSDNYISTCTVSDLQVELPGDRLAASFERADPRKWSTFAGDFFRRSNPVRLRNGTWELSDEDWDQPGTHQLYEIAVAQINETIGTEFHNILAITNYKNEFKQIDGRSRSTQAVTFSYDYALEQGLGSKLGISWEPEGLDVDNGSYSAVATRDNPGDRWTVMIKITKTLRYTIPQNSPSEIAAVLNTMAPALLSVFMRVLAYETIHTLNGNGAPAPMSLDSEGERDG